jgi:hypothetical protein
MDSWQYGGKWPHIKPYNQRLALWRYWTDTFRHLHLYNGLTYCRLTFVQDPAKLTAKHLFTDFDTDYLE